MSKWTPISKRQLIKLIEQTIENLPEEEFRFYEWIRIPPQKWELDPWGNVGDGFWVIGIIGSIVLWYNDIEEGFNHSNYTKLGIIGEYWCDQDEFDIAVKRLHSYTNTGIGIIKSGPPVPIS